MPKINQEEYKILKELLSDGYEWIARDSHNSLYAHRHKPIKQDHWIQPYRGNGGNGYKGIGYKEIDDGFFQFIQWEDGEPYDIQELIEEYEYSTDHVSHVINERVKALGNAWKESEETEVRKDLEWLKDEILTDMRYLEGNREIQQLDIKYQTLREVAQKINSLDEPEVLSQELPIIPQFVADWIENKKENEWGDLFDAMRELLNIPLSGHQESGVARWIRKAGIEDFGLEFEDVLAKLWLDGYEVAEESKYRLKLNGDYLSSAQIDYEAEKGKPIEVTIRADVKGLPYNFSEDEKSYVEKYLNVEVEELEE